VDPTEEINWIPFRKSGGSHQRKLGGSGGRKFCNHKLSSVVKSIIVFHKSKAITIEYYFVAEFTKMNQNNQEIAV
jgi:hypothetical protein